MLYQNIIDGTFGYTLQDVRMAHPNSSIPDNTTEVGDFLAYETSMQPVLTWSQNVIESAPVNGLQVWTIVESTQLIQDARSTIEAENVRAERNSRLSSTDWTQLADAQISADRLALVKSYRQALRDVTSQPGFPWDISWPELS